MSRALLLVFFHAAASGCGGASPRIKEEPVKSPDKGFRDFAASHGIATLEGGPSEKTPETGSGGLRLERVSPDRPVKMDGIVDEWPPMTKADVVIAGQPSFAVQVGLQVDDAHLYIGAAVESRAWVAGLDRLELLLAIPQSGGGYASVDLALYPGKPGESEGKVRLGRSAAAGVIVEAPSDSGYSMEARVPWAALPDGRTTRVGIRGVARYVESGAIVATGPGDLPHPAAMPWLPSEPELAMIEQLLGPKGLADTPPEAELVANLTADGTRERVAVYERYLTICGSGFLGGTGFFYRDLGGELVKLEARDVSGRGAKDVLVRRRVHVGDATREVLEVLSALDEKSEPRVTFAHEIAVVQGDHRVVNAVRLGRGTIEVRPEPTATWDATSYAEPVMDDVAPILLPWERIDAQVWRWDGTRFAERPTPPVTHAGGLSASALAAYRAEHGVADLAPKADLRVQVAGTPDPERVVLLGRDLIVFGPSFRGGSGYVSATLTAFADARDIEDVSARDLTGDGAADVVVRGVRRVESASGQASARILAAYTVHEEGIERIFAIETAREQGRKRVQGLVQFVPSAKGNAFDVIASPGRAVGWTAKTFPWRQEQPGSGDVQPLILPWSHLSSVRYSWNGTRYALIGD